MDDVDVDVDVEEIDVDIGLNPELDVDFDFDTFTFDDGSLAPPDTVFESSDSSSRHSSEIPDLSRPYHTKRPHRKSRAGCQQCKKRKVKCDETRPTCKACRLRKENCMYPTGPAPTSKVLTSSKSANAPPPGSSPRPFHECDLPSIVIAEPLFRPCQVSDATDMKMLWFYTTVGYQFFSIQTGRSNLVDDILKVKIVQHAFESPFLMDSLMAVSAMHLQNLDQPIPARRALNYRAKAFEGYRTAIEAANPQDFPALIANSLLMIALSSQMFRDPDGKPLYIVDWMQVWRGIGLIVEMVSPQVLQQSGLAVLFYRPPVDLEKAAAYIPNNLLFMIASIKPGDGDEDHQQTYYDMLKYLGSLYQELKEHGFNSILDLRIITFFTFIPKTFIPLAKEHRPRALVLLAYYLCFAKIPLDVWWMRGIAHREMKQIFREMKDEWAHLLRVPQMVFKTNDHVEIARLLIDNRNWTPTEMDQYERDRDPRLQTDLKLVDAEGREVEVHEGEWKFKTVVRSTERVDTDLEQFLETCEFQSNPHDKPTAESGSPFPQSTSNSPNSSELEASIPTIIPPIFPQPTN